MYQINEDNSIYVTRGDIVTFGVTAKDGDQPYTFQPGDVVRIKVFGKKDTNKVVLQKDFPVTTATEVVEIYLDERDTKIGEVISKPVDYWYEVELNPLSDPQTIIGYGEDGPAIFKLFPEGRDLEEYEYTEEDIPLVDGNLDLTSARPVENQAIARAVARINGTLSDTNNALLGLKAKTAADTNELLKEIDVERARISNLAKLNEGSTTGDAELIDARVGADGATHSSVGGAIRNQFANVAKWKNQIINNLCQPVTKIEYDTGISPTGVTYPVAGNIVKTVELTGGETYFFPQLNNARNATVFFDAQGNFICTFAEIGYHNTFVDVPDNAAYVKYVAEYDNDFIINKAIYNENRVVPYELSALVRVPRAEVAGDIDGVLDIDKTTFKNRYLDVNLLVPNEVEENCYYSYASGAKMENAGYYSTGLIPIGAKQTLAVFDSNMSVCDIRMACFYDNNKEFIGGAQNIREYTQVGDVAYVRFSISNTAENVMIADAGVDEYVECGSGGIIKKSLLPKSVFNNAAAAEHSCAYNGGERVSVNADAVASGTLLTVSKFPHYIKNGIGITFRADFDAFSSVKIGKGYQEYRGNCIEITQSKIISKRYESAEKEIDSIAHCLEIRRFIQVCIDVNGDDCAVTINTLGGSFTHVFKWDCEQCGELFAISDGDVSGVTLSAVCKQLRSPCWLFGDSYFGVNLLRVCGHLREMGYFENLLIDGKAGLNSANALADLRRCLAFSTPKYLVWYLGMNDSTEGYRSALATLQNICNEANIQLILNKVPCTPTMDKSGIDDIVVNSGLRFIDSFAAVGVNSSNEWHDGYLSGDNVHPDVIGAKALAMQILVDAPEIMQY